MVLVLGVSWDPNNADGLRRYKPHIEKWTKYFYTQYDTLVWNTELGWANVHLETDWLNKDGNLLIGHI
jgi:hypothetical protein